jgi:hypothetical protein
VENIWIALALGVILAFVGFNACLKFWRETSERQMLFEAQKHLLDKLGSAAEVTQFLASGEGKDFIDRLKPPPPPEPQKPPGPAEVLFLLIWVGMIMIGIGVGFLISTVVEPKLIIPGTVILLAGLGLLIGLRTTHYLATRWGLFKRPDISQDSKTS